MIGGLSFGQWLIVLAKAPPIIAKVKTALPVLVPILDDVRSLIHELGLDQPTDKPLTPKEVAEKIGLGDLTPEEQALYDRMSGNIG